MTTVPRLRAATYLSPSIPVEYFETILHYLESKLGLETTLLYESRWEGPKVDRRDPFLHDELDLAWMSSTVFLRMLKSGKSCVELLPVSSVHQHVRGEDRPGYFADVIIHRDLSEEVKEFTDLRGSKWAYNCPESLSGHIITLHTLKNLGENASFFGNISYSGSHLESIRLVLGKKADAAAVDANCLASFFDRNPQFRKELKILTWWGMLPPYPFVVNSKLPETMKKKIVECLLNFNKDIDGAKKLAEFRVRRFAPVSMADFDQEIVMMDHTKNMSFGTIYY